MKITRRVRRLAAYAHGEQPQAPNVIKLNTNEAAYPPSAKVTAALKDFDPECLRRYPDAEFRDLRAALAKLNGTSPENIFVGNGSDEVLSLAVEAFVEDDEAIATLDPSYSLYRTLAAIRGVRWVELSDPKSPEMKKVSLVLWTNPNNPTGTLVPQAEIAAFARRFRGVVLVDEAYVDYASRNCMSLATAPRNGNVIVMRTFSKAYALAGLRIGYCVGPKDLIAALYRIKDSYNVDAVAQHLALAAVRDQEGLHEIVSKVIRTRTWFTDELVRRGWDVLPSEANFVFARPPSRRTARADAARVFEELRERGIYVRYFKGAKTGDRVRFTIGTDAQMRRVLREVDDILLPPFSGGFVHSCGSDLGSGG